MPWRQNPRPLIKRDEEDPDREPKAARNQREERLRRARLALGLALDVQGRGLAVLTEFLLLFASHVALGENEEPRSRRGKCREKWS